MSLVPVTVNIERDTETDDDYGGVTAVSSTIYSGLSATINYISPRTMQRAEQAAGAGGPGVATRARNIVKFEPVPSSTTILVNDRVYVQDTAERWLVIGVRTYEYTLQLDVERVA